MTRSPLKTSPSLAETFAAQSIVTWNLLRATYNRGLLLREETLTELLLAEVTDRHPLEAVAIPFTPQGETVIGADWEWWLTDGHEWLGILVQAKALNIPTQKYRKLNYRPKDSPHRQLEIHIANALHRSLFPLLCFYNYAPQTNFIEWNCGSFDRKDALLGCCVADARVVAPRARRKAIGFQAISSISFPLLCLIGCFGFARPPSFPSRPTLPQRAHGLLTRLAGMPIAGIPRDIAALASMSADRISRDPPQLQPEPPGYIRRLLSAGVDERRSIMEEIRRDLRVSGILILKDSPD